MQRLLLLLQTVHDQVQALCGGRCPMPGLREGVLLGRMDTEACFAGSGKRYMW